MYRELTTSSTTFKKSGSGCFQNSGEFRAGLQIGGVGAELFYGVNYTINSESTGFFSPEEMYPPFPTVLAL